VPVTFVTLCIHGDTPGAVAAALRLRTAAQTRGITIRPPG